MRKIKTSLTTIINSGVGWDEGGSGEQREVGWGDFRGFKKRTVELWKGGREGVGSGTV